MSDKFHTIAYTTPRHTDMAVILVFFNPQDSVRIVQNILMVKYYLDKASIPYFIGELAFNDKPLIFKPAENIVQFRSASYMFYKENLINAVLKIVPEKYTKLCMLDADILFDNPNWYSTISKKLDAVEVCQPFKRTHFLGPDFKDINVLTNCVDSPADAVIIWRKEHSGHVWAFRRSCYNELQLSDETIIGGGDMLVCVSARKQFVWDHPNYKLYSHILPPTPRPTSVGSCDLDIYHLYHGSLVDRQYEERITDIHKCMAEIGISTLSDAVVRRADGILEWKIDYMQHMNSFMKRYFSRRQDDKVTSDIIDPRFFPTVYATPNKKDMAVILVFFNPVQYNRILQNILTVVHWLDVAGIPYYIGEVAFEDKPFLFNQKENIYRYRSNSYLFYKENLISLVERQLPTSITKVCALDADILFNHPNWYDNVSKCLDTVDICQPFNVAYWLNPDYTNGRMKSNCLGSSSSSIDWLYEHPGFVWAFTRKWYQMGTYKDIKIASIGGDTILHDFIKNRKSQLHRLYESDYKHWSAASITTTYCDLKCTVYHLNHGKIEHRNYGDITNMVLACIKKNGYYTIADAVIITPEGLFEWRADIREQLNAFHKEYFAARLEDNV